MILYVARLHLAGASKTIFAGFWPDPYITLMRSLQAEGRIDPGTYVVCHPADEFLNATTFTVDDNGNIALGYDNTTRTQNISTWPPKG